MSPLIVPIALTVVALGADYLIRKDSKNVNETPVVTEDDEVVVVAKTEPLTFGQWVDRMPKQTKTVGVMALAGAIAVARKKKIL